MPKDHISICICTYHRNRSLENLLSKLAFQDTGNLFDFSIVVVDNDADGPAEETVTGVKHRLGLEITYGIEPVRTIPAARNHSIRLAKGNYIGIIDDDEFPPPQWLLTLYRAIHTFDVDGALGPVHPFFEQSPPDWLLKSGLCERPFLRSGTLLHWEDTRTGNVLLKKSVFDEHQLQFDLSCKTSGSDKEFFREAMALGYRFVAVEEAPVYEIVPPERQTKSYYLRRAIVHASNERKYRAPMLHGVKKILVPIKFLVALGIYSFLLPFCFIRGTHIVMKCLEKVVYHSSWLLRMLGVDLAKERGF